MADDDENDHQEIQGLENEDSRYYHANKERRSFLHVRLVSFSCRTRERSSNHSREMASNIRAFLLDDPGFNDVFKEKSADLVERDRRYAFEQAYLQAGGDIAAFDHMTADQQENERARIATYILSLDASEKMDALGLDTIVSCKLRGYEKELFVLKAWIAGIPPYWVGRVCYHVIFTARYTDPIEFDDLKKKLEWKGSLSWKGDPIPTSGT